ncbi:MAG: metalloregulator ArsR/SmtB family transcription factor [Planctomycetota bacterium]|nr:metalloregulator ArsR/SmtB family transcription factor [Planctomycetota bacterium]
MSVKPRHDPLPSALVEAVAERFRVLAAPSRLRILDHLLQGPCGMAELAAATGLGQSNLSRHVAELERGGCVRRVREGRHVIVEVADPSLAPLCELVCGAIQAQAEDQHRRFTEA